MASQNDYYVYINSPAWHNRAAAARRRAGNCCQVCGKPHHAVPLTVHHRNYTRLGRERDDDLIVLCLDCQKVLARNRCLPPKPVLSILDLKRTPETPKAAGEREFIAVHPAHVPAPQQRPLHPPVVGWLLACVAAAGLIFSTFTATANMAPLAKLTGQAAPVAMSLIPPLPTAAAVDDTGSDSPTALVAYQAAHYVGPGYLANCPYSRTDVNLRTGPSKEQAHVLQVLPANTCLPLSARTADGAWYAFMVDLEDGSQTLGWVFGDLVVDAPADLPVIRGEVVPPPASAPKPLPLRLGPAQ